MKFIYEYRTSDNVRRSGVIDASDRESAFIALKNQGIRPASMKEAPGIFNKLFGKGKRWIAIVILSCLCFLLLVWMFREKGKTKALQESQEAEVGVTLNVADEGGYARSIERRQIWGDSAIIEDAARKNWKVIFSNPAERLLALFAQPGRSVQMPILPSSLEQDMQLALKNRTKILADDLEEYKQMKCIVAGMKEEVSEYLSSGGNLRGYIMRLVERQKDEVAILENERKSLQEAIKVPGVNIDELWMKSNQQLRSLGLPTIPKD